MHLLLLLHHSFSLEADEETSAAAHCEDGKGGRTCQVGRQVRHFESWMSGMFV